MEIRLPPDADPARCWNCGIGKEAGREVKERPLGRRDLPLCEPCYQRILAHPERYPSLMETKGDGT